MVPSAPVIFSSFVLRTVITHLSPVLRHSRTFKHKPRKAIWKISTKIIDLTNIEKYWSEKEAREGLEFGEWWIWEIRVFE